MMARFKEQRGVAMIVALMVAFVVLILATGVVTLALHNSEQSAFDRKRLLAINAAEAGLDYYYNYLESFTQIRDLETDPPLQTLGSAPDTVTFAVTARFFRQGASISPPFSPQSPPDGVLIHSEGKVGRAVRVMESYVRLQGVYGSFKGAIISNNPPLLGNSFRLAGNPDDGDIYVLNGNLSIPNGTNGFIGGSLFAPRGTISIGGALDLEGSAWRMVR